MTLKIEFSQAGILAELENYPRTFFTQCNCPTSVPRSYFAQLCYIGGEGIGVLVAVESQCFEEMKVPFPGLITSYSALVNYRETEWRNYNGNEVFP